VEAACLPTAWLTAYRMLFVTGRATAGQRVLVQGSGGGLATAAILLGRAAELEIVVTGRDEERRARALALGAAAAVEPGARVPRVDLVLESVGKATWSHSVRSVKPGGTIVVAGATSGDASPAELTRIFFQEITVAGTTMGSRTDLEHLLEFLVTTGVRPLVDSTFPLGDARSALARLAQGAQVGKIVLEVGA
jgi:NADPH:quinone reductase-like Zn-dependent oxidoreductase